MKIAVFGLEQPCRFVCLVKLALNQALRAILPEIDPLSSGVYANFSARMVLKDQK